MIVSLNEIEGVALKAARGSGLPWGLAEETARAARWLALHDLPWDRSLAALLEREATAPSVPNARAPLPRPSPRRNEGAQVASPAFPVSPLHFTPYLSDLGPAALPWRLGPTRHPLWLLPAVADMSATGPQPTLDISWLSVGLRASGGTVHGLWRHEDALSVPVTDTVTIAPAPTAGLRDLLLISPHLGGRAVDAAAWQRLERLAHATYVEASTRSRLACAGAGLQDND